MQDRTFVVILTLAIGISGAAAAWVSVLRNDGGSDRTDELRRPRASAGSRSPDLRPKPATTDDPPVLIESVSRLRGNLAGKDFVLPQAPAFDSAELREFNEDIYPNSAKFNDWYSA